LNHHGVPSHSMFFNVIASLLVVGLGGAVEIYTFSNVGYIGSFLPVLLGYYLLRNNKPNARRPFRLPEFMKYVAWAMARLYGVVGLYGGWVYSEIGNTKIYFVLGWVVLFAYLPLYWYRTRIEDPKVSGGLAKPQFASGPSTPIHSK